MATTLKGRAVVYKRTGEVSWEGQAALTAQIAMNLNSRDEFNPQKLIIGGKTLSIGADERTESLSVTITPAAAATVDENNLANAEAACERPDPLAIVELDFGIESVDGEYNYQGGELTFPDGYATHNMNLERYDGAALPALDT